QDFYMEGMLLWYECDAIIRDKTNGAKSLDDFCKRFFAAVPGQMSVSRSELADGGRELSPPAAYHWEALLQPRVAGATRDPPLDVLGQRGYRLKYSDKPPGAELKGAVLPPDNPAADSLGVVFMAGEVRAVDPGLPADKAGLAPGMKVIGVNGKKFSPNRLRDA